MSDIKDAQTEIKRLRAALYAIDYGIDDHGRALSFIEMLREKDAEIKRLRAALDAIDDHGRALSFIDMLREKDAEIEDLKKRYVYTEIEKLRAEIERLKALLKECVQNVYYSESACPPSWLRQAQEAIK